MKKVFFKLLALLLGFLFNSCELGPINDIPAVEYGMPMAKYTISGFVKDSQDAPIKGIEINYQGVYIFSNADGSFSIDESLLYCPDCKLSAEDIDGPDNGGEYQNQEIDLTLTQTEPPSGNWDKGSYEQNDIEIILDKNE